MEYFLVRLADRPAAWSGIIENTTSSNQRLAPVRKPLHHPGGSMISFGSFGTEHSKGTAAPPHVVTDEFVIWSGHDLLTAMAIPDHEAACIFKMAISAKAGLKIADPTPILPTQEAMKAMLAAKAAMAQTGCAAPGRARP